nr:hypothetical protein CFP56_20336 [Quercus suber]
MSLRNELRPAQDGNDSALTYGWEEWYDNMIPAAEGIHSNNSSPLIFLSGLAYDSDVSPLVNKKFTLDGTNHFDPSAFDFSNKLVLELHDYQGGAAACSDIKETLYGGGYGAMNVSDSLYYHVPVVLTEFGFGQIDGSDEGVYAQCIKDYLTSLPGGPGGWMQWLLSGSYYVRQGTANYEEVWGKVSASVFSLDSR